MKNEKFDQVIDEVYKHYQETHQYEPFILKDEINLSKEVFIKKATNNYGFSQLFGLTLNERELSFNERKKIYEEEFVGGFEVKNNDWLESKLKTRDVPTKVIKISYNGNTIESYE
jgi:hypothetical protein